MEATAEWQVEPTPRAILDLLRTTDAADADPGWVDAWNGAGDGPGRSLRAFLGEAGHGMLRFGGEAVSVDERRVVVLIRA
jgi:hypothetical protein